MAASADAERHDSRASRTPTGGVLPADAFVHHRTEEDFSTEADTLRAAYSMQPDVPPLLDADTIDGARPVSTVRGPRGGSCARPLTQVQM